MFGKDITRPWIRGESASAKRTRARKILARLRKRYPNAKIALKFGNPMQLLAAVIMSAQCTDKKVNEVTAMLFKKYRSVDDFADADARIFAREIKPTGFYRAKALAIITSARAIRDEFGGKVPRTMEEILKLRGVARKTANVVLGNAYGVVEGIAVDTHVRRLAQRMGFSTRDDPVKIEKDLMALFPKKEWFKLTYVLIDHGRAICTARGRKCSLCPLKDICPASLA
ncbi:MAG: endonuclease III [Candidatus Sungbacteria bacterium RIFCSPLOWO2_01_FULL_60_25]|uniref:Endonuclease III n=1 Tax=Candidatus Sungbacteria bacterium RIFCSPLOWO2_01_FULL_60_25 TaxID=1802281 RepID=A0A1G2LG80_9BACT|nr:MAG: endonuclease III [Candidatus Sungbacteria bacterium RIFCSPLOWO2_01_FULL_60_25]